MRLAVDANILFAALLRDGTTRRLILEGNLDLHAPEWIWDEVEANREMLLRRSGATGASLDLLVGLMRDAIHAVPNTVTSRFLKEAFERLPAADAADGPYVATAMALGAALWSHDKRLARRAGIKVQTTEELLRQAS